MRIPRKLRPLKYKWSHRSDSQGRFDLVLMGEPDAFAYIVRYSHPTHFNIYGNVHCWSLTTPRGMRGLSYTGWEHTAAKAKRAVEDKIAEIWL